MKPGAHPESAGTLHVIVPPVRILSNTYDFPCLFHCSLEEDVPRALALLPRLQRWYAGDHELRVAQAAETDYPKAALDIYRRRAERLINARGRGNYRTAAALLVRIRDVYRRQDDHDSALRLGCTARQSS